MFYDNLVCVCVVAALWTFRSTERTIKLLRYSEFR
jgi:hypothetical protein